MSQTSFPVYERKSAVPRDSFWILSKVAEEEFGPHLGLQSSKERFENPSNCPCRRIVSGTDLRRDTYHAVTCSILKKNVLGLEEEMNSDEKEKMKGKNYGDSLEQRNNRGICKRKKDSEVSFRDLTLDQSKETGYKCSNHSKKIK